MLVFIFTGVVLSAPSGEGDGHCFVVDDSYLQDQSAIDLCHTHVGADITLQSWSALEQIVDQEQGLRVRLFCMGWMLSLPTWIGSSDMDGAISCCLSRQKMSPLS